ncbi:proline and serine-rich protein 3 isoform X2 [Nerophis lumbriciformis]|uniref:proline and serine-rich protein 3 isoform X2 n=1 Tax=Nerophis lumbriciformis TaxID=546530 RepID=UPI002AE0A391|nr:proline and serine-rich protein 3 isoform X2 [Nerophis lumbriciformis]
MKSRNSVMTRLKTPQPASPPTGNAPFGQPRHKALPDKRNKASLIPVLSNQKDNPKVHRPEEHGDQWTAEKRQPSLAQSGISMDKDSSSTLSDTDIILMLSSRAQQATVSSCLGQQQHSRVDTYIDRFRYGQPMSREERQQMSSVIEGDTTPFWRLSSSSLPPSSALTKTPHIDDHRRELFSSVTRQSDEDFNSSTCRGDYNMDAYQYPSKDSLPLHQLHLLHAWKRTFFSSGVFAERWNRPASCVSLSNLPDFFCPLFTPLYPFPQETSSLTRPREGGCIETKVAPKDKAQKKQLRESQTDGAIRKQKKSARRNERSENTDSPNITSRSSAHQKPPQKNKSRIEQHKQQLQEIRKKEDNHTRPFSPVQQSLEQVVSEVLFPPTESSPAKVAAVPLLPTPSQSSHPPCDTHNSLEVMSQLLQEAEDSDEIEFADDPLLQVLRTQRKWVKEQISEVNSMVYKFLITQEASPT